MPFLSILVALSSFCQSPIDSLEYELTHMDKGTGRYLRTVTLLAKEYAEIKADTALKLTEFAIKQAIEHHQDSALGQIYIAKSTAWSFLAQYDSAMRYSFKALRKSEQYKDTITMIDAYTNIGIDYMYQDQYLKAIEYFSEVENLSVITNDSIRLGHVLNNLGMMNGLLEKYDTELEYYEKAAEIFLLTGEKDGYANTLMNSGTVFTVKNEFVKAESLYKKALGEFQNLQHHSGIQNTLQSWAENALKNKEFGKANKLANQALEIALKFSLSQDVVYTYDLLEQIALAQRDFKAAYEFEIKESEVKEELFSKERSKQISELEAKYQAEKRKQQIELLTTQNELSAISLEKKSREQMTVIIAAIVLLIIGFSVTYFIIRQARLKERLLTEETDNLRLRITSLIEQSPEAPEIELEELNNRLVTPLTEREFEVFELAISQHSNSEIAEKVFLSVNTVKFHLKKVYEKLGVANRREALHFAIKQEKSTL